MYGLSQNKLAVAAGITRQYLNEIEMGKTVPSVCVRDSLLEALKQFNPDAQLTMLFDYVRIRFPTMDVTHVVRDILKLKLAYMIHEDFGFYSYAEHYYMGDIFVLTSPETEKGILLELKGKGCRQFECFLLAQHRSWYDFFMAALCEGGVIKRLDLAINDMVGLLDIPRLTEKCRNHECVSLFRSFKSYQSGELTQQEEDVNMGNTLYIGSLKSEVYFCIYEKDYEQLVKNGIPLAESQVKNRFEIRLKNDRAFHAVKDLLTHYDAGQTAFAIINRYLRFANKDETKRRSAWTTDEQWRRFIGEGQECLRLTTKPEPYTIERTLNWLHRQVAPTLKAVMKLDELHDTKIMTDMIKNAKLNDRLKKVIKQQSIATEKIIVTEKEGG